ncbi:preprotein translocase subunit Sec61beta [Candidatus Woesearchaeota archaeon]|nr:preprotein translocase subunit Sec61beta [Candidatus Woesearchaeota archaeon]
MAERIQMPQSSGGIIRYTEDYQSKLEFSPVWVVVMIVLVVLIELALFALGSNFLK